MEMISGSRGRQVVSRRPISPGFPPRYKGLPHYGQRSRRRLRQEVYYADGGRSTRYLGTDDDEAEIQGDNDSPGTRRYTVEVDSDLPETPDQFPTSPMPPSHSLSMSSHSTSSQDDLPVMAPKIARKAATSIPLTRSPRRCSSEEI